MTHEQLWEAVLGEIEVNLTRANFVTWFKDTSIADIQEPNVVLRVPNSFTHSWLEKKYSSLILKALKKFTDTNIRELTFIVEAPKASKTESASAAQAPSQQATSSSGSQQQAIINNWGLNTKYTFDNFIVGKGNELAHAACVAVSNQPGSVYNPLFIYGGSGLGKTHLIQATGHKIAENKGGNPKILFVSTEKFTNEYIYAIKTGGVKEFQDKYRSLDVLLVDDIQFIEGKPETQEAFFHTFNTLHQNNRQIILTSDRPPKAIATIEQRLLSRFEWGMIADIGNPDYETRVAILEAKCQEKGLHIEDEIIRYVANVVNSNIRELEGALNRIIADHSIRGLEPTLEGTKKVLSTIAPTTQKQSLTPKHIIDTVSSFYGVDIQAILGKSRKKELVLPRQIIMFLMREELQASFPQIGQELGGKDHTTAMHSVQKIANHSEENEKLRNEISALKQKLYNDLSV